MRHRRSSNCRARSARLSSRRSSKGGGALVAMRSFQRLPCLRGECKRRPPCIDLLPRVATENNFRYFDCTAQCVFVKTVPKIAPAEIHALSRRYPIESWQILLRADGAQTEKRVFVMNGFQN